MVSEEGITEALESGRLVNLVTAVVGVKRIARVVNNAQNRVYEKSRKSFNLFCF